jgi:hypothetical protein
MPRSNGYRPRKAVKAEVMALRAKLNQLTTSQWQKASMLMHEICDIMGHTQGPSNGMIEPRACRYCHYYGHTRQWCPRLKDAEVRQADRMLQEDAEWARVIRERVAKLSKEPYDVRKTKQALHFDEIGVPYTIDEDCGAIVAAPGDVCAGKWSFA